MGAFSKRWETLCQPIRRFIARLIAAAAAAAAMLLPAGPLSAQDANLGTRSGHQHRPHLQCQARAGWPHRHGHARRAHTAHDPLHL